MVDLDSTTLNAEKIQINNTRLIKGQNPDPLNAQLSKYHNKRVSLCVVKCKPSNLHRQSDLFKRSTILVEVKINADEVDFQPGDHIGIFAENRREIVDTILDQITGVEDNNEILQLQILKEKHTSTGKFVRTAKQYFA